MYRNTIWQQKIFRVFNTTSYVINQARVKTCASKNHDAWFRDKSWITVGYNNL